MTFQNPTALAAIPLLWLFFLLIAWRRRFQPFGPFVVRLIILVMFGLALAQPVQQPPPLEQPPEPPPTRWVILADQSTSLGEANQQLARTEARRLADNLTGEVYLLHFAEQLELIASPILTTSKPSATNISNNEATDLAQALQNASNLLADAEAGQIILLSDGQATQGDVAKAIEQLVAQQIPVNTVDLSNLQPDVAVTQLIVPSVLREGEPFVLEVELFARQETEANLQIVQDGQIIQEGLVPLVAGSNTFDTETPLVAERRGLTTFEALIGVDDDQFSQNNQLTTFARVYPPPEVLVVGDSFRLVRQVSNGLRDAGYIPAETPSSELPNDLTSLEKYAGMILVNVSVRELSLDQTVAVQEFVRSMGRGLFVIGGQNSLSLGSYAGTPLAETLPVTMEPPPREERPPVALLLIIDHSGSMVEQNRVGPTKLAMAKEAAIRATDILGPEDRLGVLMFDNTNRWVLEFQPVQDGLLNIQSQIARILPGGGTRILSALEAGLPPLIDLSINNGAKHAILLTDGKSFDGFDASERYLNLITQINEAKVTLSTIAIGRGADQELLSFLAEVGGGRYHFASQPEALPALTISESDIVRSNSLQEDEEEPYQASPTSPHPMVRTFFGNPDQLADLPLTGYLALTPKETAEVALQIGPSDPLLVVWGYGLGRAAVWTSDAGQEWAAPWFNGDDWSETSRFWGQLVGYTLPSPELSLLRLSAQVQPNGVVTVQADSVDNRGQTIDLARTHAILTGPTGQVTPFLLRQTGPGTYQQTVQLNQSGVYELTVTQTQADGAGDVATIGFVIPYSPEYAPDNPSVLQVLVAQTDGQQLPIGQTPLLAQPSNLTEKVWPEPVLLWPWFLALALALWPLEIGWRRWRRLRIQ